MGAQIQAQVPVPRALFKWSWNNPARPERMDETVGSMLEDVNGSNGLLDNFLILREDAGQISLQQIALRATEARHGAPTASEVLTNEKQLHLLEKTVPVSFAGDYALLRITFSDRHFFRYSDTTDIFRLDLRERVVAGGTIDADSGEQSQPSRKKLSTYKAPLIEPGATEFVDAWSLV